VTIGHLFVADFSLSLSVCPFRNVRRFSALSLIPLFFLARSIPPSLERTSSASGQTLHPFDLRIFPFSPHPFRAFFLSFLSFPLRSLHCPFFSPHVRKVQCMLVKLPFSVLLPVFLFPPPRPLLRKLPGSHEKPFDMFLFFLIYSSPSCFVRRRNPLNPFRSPVSP